MTWLHWAFVVDTVLLCLAWRGLLSHKRAIIDQRRAIEETAKALKAYRDLSIAKIAELDEHLEKCVDFTQEVIDQYGDLAKGLSGRLDDLFKFIIRRHGEGETWKDPDSGQLD